MSELDKHSCVTDSPVHAFIPLIQPRRCACMEKETMSTNKYPVLNILGKEEHTNGRLFRGSLCRVSYIPHESRVFDQICSKDPRRIPVYTLISMTCAKCSCRDTQRKNTKLLSLEILSLKPSEKKTKMYFLKQYFQQKKKRKKKRDRKWQNAV